MKKFVILFLVFFKCLAFSENGFCQTSSQENHIRELIKKARLKKLHESARWRVLIHYKKTALGNWESEVDSPTFFNSADGKFDPQKELAETIKAFFQKNADIAPGLPHPQCRFIARFKWLSGELGFNSEQILRRSCSKYRKWKKMLDPESVTLVFPAYDLFAPGSMFGHTLLRINSKGNQKTSILNFSVNFAADVDVENENEISYAVKGLFGGFKGYFNVVPYWEKVREYSDIDFRDIWEFDLPLNKEEVDRLLDHVWELKFVYIDYYFLKENCSYHLLSLLEAAKPEWNLQNNYLFWATPTGTVRDVMNLLSRPPEPVYRPSRHSKYLRKREKLSERNFEIYKKILKTKRVKNEEFQSLAVEDKALILDLMIDRHSLQRNGKTSQKQKIELLKKRASLKFASPSIQYKPTSSPPDKGHGTFKTGFAAGLNSDGLGFNEVLLRMSFHDLLDSETGFSPHSQLEFGKLVLRREKESVYIKEFFLIDVYSLFGADEAVNPPSWRIAVGWFKDMTLNAESRQSFTTQGGIGKSYEFLNSRYYQLLETHFNASGSYRKGYQFGPGLKIGLISRWNDYIKSDIGISWLNLLFGQNDIYMKYTLRARFKINEQNEIRIKYHHVKNEYESALGWNVFF